jgi:hypothetical protein
MSRVLVGVQSSNGSTTTAEQRPRLPIRGHVAPSRANADQESDAASWAVVESPASRKTRAAPTGKGGIAADAGLGTQRLMAPIRPDIVVPFTYTNAPYRNCDVARAPHRQGDSVARGLSNAPA